MKNIYLRLFQKAYAWSGKHEFDGQPSLFSATLYVSALQFINLLTVMFFAESLNSWKIEISRWVAGFIPVGLFAFNWLFGIRNTSKICERGERNLQEVAPFYRYSIPVYLILTAGCFVISVVVFVYTGP